jgi:aspartyl-tRNA(Asn)/glutamyl-tRNA(Gln) amidotransferase subunit A
VAADARAGGRLMNAATPNAHWLSVAEIGAAYRSGALTPEALVQHLLARIARLDPALHSFIAVDAEAALEQARAAGREMAAGRWRGPLHGVPVGVKDIIDMAGQVTSCHSRLTRGQPPAAEDATVIRRLRGAGAIMLGKLALHEFAIGGPSEDAAFPPARNPWNPRHHPGGSSSGSGVAVAAGFVPLTLGTDTGGSIRNPAGHCGVAGLKPTYGAVSRHGVYPLSYTLDHVGPLARSVGDLALAMNALAGHDAADPGSCASRTRDHAADIGRGARGLRVGLVRHFHEEDERATDEVIHAIDHAAALLAAEGAVLRDVRLPSLQRFTAAQKIFLHAESWAVHAEGLRQRPGDYSAIARRKLMTGAFLTAGDYVQAQRWRAVLIDAVNNALREVDVLIVANSLDPACEIDDEAEFTRTYGRQARVPFNLTGHPALAMMCGLSQTGLPLAVQFVGRYHDDRTVLRAGAALERAGGWLQRRAPLME